VVQAAEARLQFEPVSEAGWLWAVSCEVDWLFCAVVSYWHASAGATIAARPQPTKSPMSNERMNALHFTFQAGKHSTMPPPRKRA
jgi:hypothetical protein